MTKKKAGRDKRPTLDLQSEICNLKSEIVYFFVPVPLIVN